MTITIRMVAGQAVSMTDVEFEAQLNAFRSWIDRLKRMLHAFAGRLPEPLRHHPGKEYHGFRYGKPHVEHFCLLKAVRAVSAVNAAIELARGGYTQEILVLMRTVA
jgi:hypothetical protein